MARIPNDQRLANLHADALRQFNDIQTALRDERLQCLQDRRFYSLCGAQWEGPLYDQYENKPKFEVNKIMLAVIRIVNEYRNNRITVDYVSKDGTENDKLAEVCDGLYRAVDGVHLVVARGLAGRVRVLGHLAHIGGPALPGAVALPQVRWRGKLVER